MKVGTPLIGITADWCEDRGRLVLRLPREYVSWLVGAGLKTVVLPATPGEEDSVLEDLDGLVLSGGGDIPPAFYGGDPEAQPEERYSHPDRCAFEFALVWRAMKRRLPVLGICLGCQTLNVSLGGTIVRHLDDPHFRHRRRAPEMPNPLHRIRSVEGTKVHAFGITRDIRVLSSHHQAVGKVAPGWIASAFGPDGVVEAIESPARPWMLGIQWHPERTPHSILSVDLARWLRVEASAHAIARRRGAGQGGS